MFLWPDPEYFQENSKKTQASTDVTYNIVRDRNIRNHDITSANFEMKFKKDRWASLLMVGDSRFLFIFIVSTAVSTNGGTVKKFAILSVFDKN